MTQDASDKTLDHFLTGLDALGTGQLTFQVLDPDELDRFLSAIRRQLREERLPFELAFNHTYQFYAEPMVMFTNTHDQLLVNVPILLRLATQKPLNLYSIDTVPMPFDTETLDGRNNEYTFINNSYPYMALNEHNYIPLTETQLRMCDKMGPTYYCQNSYVLHQRTQHTCESAIYYKMDAKTITKHCQAKFAANVEFTPKVLDAGETMVLFNLPRLWILLCGQEKQPTEIDFTTYKVVDRKEFCECSLTARSFQLDETLVKCTPEINSEADGLFKSYFAINKIIFDYLQAEKDVQLDSTVVQALSRLLDVKPEYDWTPLNWYVNPDLLLYGYNNRPHSAIYSLSPARVNAHNQRAVHEIQYGDYLRSKCKKHKYQIGDKVRIASYRNVFRKSYQDTTFTRELFEIVDTLQTNPPTYKLKDLKEGELIEGTFYEEELQRVRPENGNA